jgi:hypothetical protein
MSARAAARSDSPGSSFGCSERAWFLTKRLSAGMITLALLNTIVISKMLLKRKGKPKGGPFVVSRTYPNTTTMALNELLAQV